MTSKKCNLVISSGISGIVEVSATHWLDRIKTKQQEQMLIGINKNLYQTLKNIYSIEGLRGFFVGIIPKFVGVIPIRTIYWTTIVQMNLFVKDHNTNLIIKNLVPGLVAGSVQTILDNPIEVLKIRLMTNTNNKVDSKVNFNFNNLKSLYVGFLPTILRNSIFAIIVASSIQKFGTKKENKFLAGAIGGFFGSVLSQPFDVVKTEMQRFKTIKNLSMSQTMINIGKHNPLHLWSGGSMRASIAFLNMGIGYYVMDSCYNLLKNINW